MTQNNALQFLNLTGIFEPSAVQQLADGRVSSAPLGSSESGAAALKLDDLEGLALDASGYLYALTSRSCDGDGDAKKSRDKLIRFRIEDQGLVAPLIVSGLKPALIAAHPVLAAAAEIRDVKDAGGLNIEALEISRDQQRLLIGFRSPLLGRSAIIASVENPSAIFESGEPPRVAATLQTLDWGGNGIRGMSYVSALGGYLLISGPADSADVHFAP
jgi:hypothetical protein